MCYDEQLSKSRFYKHMTYIKKTLLLINGLVFIVIGIISLVLPVFPGVLFLFIGITSSAKGSRRIGNNATVKRIISTIDIKIQKMKSTSVVVKNKVLMKIERKRLVRAV